jgi:macrolide-specific efflux system membrane fusion protein
MKTALAALLLGFSAPALGAQKGAVRRGDLIIRVKVSGTVVPGDVFRLKSTIEGRIESINASTYSWRGSDEPLAMLTHKELAAMIDMRGAQKEDLLEDRWSRVYRPTPVRCPDTCFVLKIYAKAHTWVKPQAVLFEAARNLKLVARVRPEDAPLVRDGMPLTFWALKDPNRRLTGRVTSFVLDVQGEKVDPGGTFTLLLDPDRYFEPGTEWEGEIIPTQKSDVLMVPTAALIQHDGATYLPVRVSTGVTSTDFTQITSGTDDKHEILILDDSQLHGAERHARTVDRAALELRRREADGAAAPDGTGAPAAPAAADGPARAERQPTTLDDKDYGGEDPYGEQ